MRIVSIAAVTSALGSAAASPPLTNEQQVGKSQMGTLDAKTYPKWLRNHFDGGDDDDNKEDEEDAPWGERTTSSTGSAWKHVPETNTTRYYDWTLTRTLLSPDGVLRDMILVNDQFPGPTLEANWGDWVEVTVHNKIEGPEDGSSIHWHGVQQTDRAWQDGVPGITQCPIAPGASFTYRFRAETYGSSFWHAHYSAQYTAGAVGAIQIYGPNQLDFDYDLGPVMLTDWYHIPYFSVVQNVLGTDYSKLPPISDGGLINGRGRFDCAKPSYSQDTQFVGIDEWTKHDWTCVDGAPYSSFRFQSGKTYKLRVMNHGADGIQKFAIDGHKMTVVAVDFVPVKPYTKSIITLGVGQRMDVLVDANRKPHTSWWMRSQMPGGLFCGGNDNTQAIRAAIYYEDADESLEPESISIDNNAECVNEPLDITEPEFAAPPGDNPYQQDVMLALELNSTGNFVFTMNSVSTKVDFNHPMLWDSAAAAANPQANLYDYGKNESIVLNVTNASPFQHPMHLHGYHFQVLASGPDEATSVYPQTNVNPLEPPSPTVWDGKIQGNPENPMRRDTHIIPALGYVAIQFQATNPGVWPFHCHTAWHQSGGMSLNVVTQPQDIPSEAPSHIADSCGAWQVWTNSNVVEQVDAGD